MIKAFSLLIIGFIALLAIPICIGLAGGLFGLVFGLIGGVIGLIAGLFGAVIGGIAWIFRSIFHVFFGWGFGHHEHWFHFNGYLFAALLILILAVALKRKK